MSRQLFAAIDQHDASRVAELLAGGDDPNALQAEGQGLRPLHAAIHQLEFGGGLDVVATLLARGADVNGWNAGRDLTPLLAAVFEHQRAAVSLLLKSGADPNVVSSEGDSPLRAGVSAGDCAMASLLLTAGAGRTINEWGGTHGYTALGLAAAGLDVPMMRMLLEAGADPEAPDEDDRTARDRLPPRDESDPHVRDVAFELLWGARGSNRGT